MIGGEIMGDGILFQNDYLKIVSFPDGVYIETFRKGFSSDQLNNIFHSHPEIDVTNFITLKTSLASAPRPLEKIGLLKERIVIDSYDNDLEATIVFNISSEELNAQRENVLIEALSKLNDKGIVFGIKKEVFEGELFTGKHYVIAQGIRPVNGTDSIITMYQLQDSKPDVNQDGTVDFYDLKLINRVKSGEWLGERIEATDGISGQSVKGLILKPLKGKNSTLNYDKNTVQEVFDGTKTTLFSRVNGAVSYQNGKITVSNHLEIAGDVDFKTGNVKFDGYVTIKETVGDGFSVEATKDIEINGELGLGNIKGLTSTHGSIFIKGGIASKGKVEIRAAKNVFTKFVDNSVIICGGSAHIGFYCINSTVRAKEIIFDSSNAQIIGGNIVAEVRVSIPIIGSEMEKRTVVEVIGFNKPDFVHELEGIANKINEIKAKQQKLKQNISHLENLGQLNPFQRKNYNDSIERTFELKDELKGLEEKKKSISGYLKTHGDGEIAVSKRIYPNSLIMIKKNSMEIAALTSSITYYVQDDLLKQV